MPLPPLPPIQIQEALQSLYREPVEADGGAASHCVEFRTLHYPPLATIARAAELSGIRFSHEDAPPGDTATIDYLRERGFTVIACDRRDGAGCGGEASLIPPD